MDKNFDFLDYINKFYREVTLGISLDEIKAQLEYGNENVAKKLVDDKIKEVAQDMFDGMDIKERQHIASKISDSYLQNLNNTMVSSHYADDLLYESTWVEKLICLYIKENANKKSLKDENIEKSQVEQKKKGLFARLFGKKENVQAEKKQQENDKEL